MKSTSFVPLILAVLALGGPSLAADWYVDAVQGSDANPGTSPAQAWRTITHALATAPSAPMGGTQVVHVAPGLYDAAHGETYPILLRDAFQIVGDQGPASTVLDGGGAASVLQAFFNHFGGNYIGPLTLVRGVTLRNAVTGVDLSATFFAMSLAVEDARITGMSAAGLRAVSGCGQGCGQVSATLARVEISGCQPGIDFRSGSQSSGSATLRLVDCDVSDNVSTGVEVGVQATGSILATLIRVRIVGNGGDGVRISNQNTIQSVPFSLRLLDCLAARNGGSGVRANLPAGPEILTAVALSILRSTIADNTAIGLDLFYPVSVFGTQHRTTLGSTILFGNQDDVRENPANPSISPVSFCDVGDGDFAGSNGNFSANPMFRGAAWRDYRLVWGGPCIDMGDPGAPAGTPDLASVPRPIDGDLDVLERNDVGAHEFAPLGVARQPHIGANLVLELWGPAGGQAELYFSRRPLAPTPQSTPFGDFDLDPSHASSLGSSSVAPGPPHFRAIPIPNNPAYVGRSFSFQALATSTLVSPPTVYTNPVRVTILP